ncbi:MAG: 3'(2'),5'-bisphosphate nucleotidase [Planctomycetia bacterium]|nr:3'(2'),5'-bisphosphate nucleotidase [Planctomycetia bacterium]
MDYSIIFDVIRDACDLTLRIQEKFVTPETWQKKDKSPVTVGDLAVQTLVAAKLSSAFPSIPLVAEESADLLQSDDGARFMSIILEFTSKYLPDVTPERVIEWVARGDHRKAGASSTFWTLDPIDGTKGFLRGGQYAIALALLEDYKVSFGVLGLPCLPPDEKGHFASNRQSTPTDSAKKGSLVYAQRGKGTWRRTLCMEDGSLKLDDDSPVRLQTSNVSDARQASFLRSFEAAHTNVSQIDLLAERMQIGGEPVLMDSQAKYAVLAAGEGDLLFRFISSKLPNYKEKIWDQAAGSIVLEEAGGKITDLDGVDLDFSQGFELTKNRGVCASNGLLHDETLRAIKEIGA